MVEVVGLNRCFRLPRTSAWLGAVVAVLGRMLLAAVEVAGEELAPCCCPMALKEAEEAAGALQHSYYYWISSKVELGEPHASSCCAPPASGGAVVAARVVGVAAAVELVGWSVVKWTHSVALSESWVAAEVQSCWSPQ